ncbi:MAG: HDIG domain-containing protein [Bacteroidia bacterium]|nr:HDIG domain-containing protein [Bacteroidia bacterium]
MNNQYKNYRFYNILLFIASALLILAVIPKGAKFPYEYKKGTAWLHKNLMSPLNFPIYKSAEELKSEKDSLLKNFTPYFRYDNQVFIDHLNTFKKKFEAKWMEHLKKYYRITDEQGTGTQSKELTKLKNDYLGYTTNLMEEIYNKGVIVLPKTMNPDSVKNLEIALIKNNIAEEYSINEFFYIKSAYEYIDKATHDRREQYNYNANIDINFIEELKLKEFVSPNLFYDNETTNKIKNSFTENVSLTRGMVNEGEKIITKGEIVDNQKLKILNSLKKEYESYITSTSNFYFIVIGQFLLVAVSLLAILFFLLSFRKDIIHNSLKTSFILLLIVLMISIVSFFLKFTTVNLYIIPLTILPIIIRTFYDTRLALFIHMVTVLMIGFFVPNGYEFALLQILAGITAIISLANVNRRGQLFLTAILIVVIYSVVFFAISIIQEGDLMKINYKNFAWFGFNGLLVLSAYPLIYIFEKAFGFLSDVSLMELTDTNHPLLRTLAEKAPGTFQHSLQVSNLVEEVMVKIGGNSLLARTGALYHDVGKIHIPQYFIENQGLGTNPHDALDFEKSAELIISHVKEGLKLADEFNLPLQIKDFIESHHGTTKVQYFYRSFIKKYPQLEVEVEKFTYSGPIPMTKEIAVVMICDSVEAAARSLKNFTEETIRNLIDSIINSHINENQLVSSDITFKDITIIKEILFIQLRNIYHSRIEYPKYEKLAVEKDVYF